MAWASRRVTTRVEDEAYCLIGIFGVNMTPKYGERTGAFVRLQRAIIKQNPDQSIFAWGPLHPNFFEARSGILELELADPTSHEGISWAADLG